MQTMGQRIKLLREAKNWSVQDLADQIGVTRSLVYQWEADAVTGIRPENFVRLYLKLGIDPQYLVWGVDRAPPGETAQSLSKVR